MGYNPRIIPGATFRGKRGGSWVAGQFEIRHRKPGVAWLPAPAYASGMPKRSSKRQKDIQELARHVLDAVVPDAEPTPPVEPEKPKNPAAVALGRLGGLKGGKARAAKLTAKERAEIARNAAMARWSKATE